MKHRGRPPGNIELWRRTFDARHGKDMAARLEERLRGEDSFVAISRDFGITRQRVQQITALLYPNHEPRWRQKAAARARLIERELNKDTPATRAIKYLAARGVKADLIIPESKNSPAALMRTITVGGLTLRIRELSHTWRVAHTGRRFYYPFRTPAGKADFILVRRENSWFVLPRSILGAVWSNHYLPAENLPAYNNLKPRINWWSYENATRLLQEGLGRKNGNRHGQTGGRVVDKGAHAVGNKRRTGYFYSG